MLYKKRVLAFSLTLMILLFNAYSVFAVSIIVSGESEEISGELSGEISGETSEEISGEIAEETLESIAQDSSISTNKNTPITSSLHADIASGETNLFYSIETMPSHGTLLYEDNTISTFTYTPDRDYVGIDTFTFKLTDGTLSSNVGMVTITIANDQETIIPFYYVDMQNHWANYSASHLAARGIIIGEEIGNRYYFKPNTLMTREDFMLYLLAITESNSDAELEIPDVTFADQSLYPDWLVEAAKLAYAKGIIKGSAQGNKLYLNLYNSITRAEACVMVSNTLKTETPNLIANYTDRNTIPSWAIDAISTLTAYKIVQGDAGYFRPNSLITKAEAAELSYKLLKQMESDEWQSQMNELK